MNTLSQAYNKVLEYMYDHNFTSFDPYDGLNTDFGWLKKTKYSRLFLVYLNKFSPINCRRLFGIKKSRQLMTLGTVANAICINGGLRKSDIAFFKRPL